jgi:hypothetical protein
VRIYADFDAGYLGPRFRIEESDVAAQFVDQNEAAASGRIVWIDAFRGDLKGGDSERCERAKERRTSGEHGVYHIAEMG